jgi:hypothetical protein
MKAFEVTYEDHDIRVENSWFDGERLYVNGQLQDENLGVALRATLMGVLKSDNRTKHIKVALGGFFTINCKIFVDNKLIFPNK